MEKVNDRVFVVREDLRGGHKMRRLSRFFAGQPVRKVAALSDRGSHTFWTLSKLLEEHPEIESARFFERQTETTPYHERLREEYCRNERVVVRRGSTVALLLSYLRTKWFTRVTTVGIGANIPSTSSCYKEVMGEVVDRPTTHILPIASGNLVEGLLSLFKEKKLSNHKICGVLTGHWLSRLFLRGKYLLHPHIELRGGTPISWEEYGALAEECKQELGVIPDPTHGVQAYRVFKQRGHARALVFWATFPSQHLLSPKSQLDYNRGR